MLSDVQKKKRFVATLSVCSNSILVVAKFGIGLLIGSVSVMAEALHSGMDLVASFIALFAVRNSDKAPDQQHQFGHGKIENISGAVEALLIFIAGIWMIVEALKKLFFAAPQIETLTLNWGIAVMCLSCLLNFIVATLLFKVGKATDSVALIADGWHLMTDVYTSAGVMISLTIITLGEKIVPSLSLHWLDPITAIAVALLILRTSWKLTLKSAKDLMDTSLPDDEINWVKGLMLQYVPTVRGFHGLRTRKAGLTRYIEFHLIVNEQMTVKDSHKLTDYISTAIKNHLPGSRVTIHIEPCDGYCKPSCLAGCLCPEAGRKAIIEHATTPASNNTECNAK
jgi:cation diffusion facilitator family transporter